MITPHQIRALITRLARLDATETWDSDLHPAQIAALDYLARANRFSRAPSQVAEFLGTTRGTTSQTLKSLVRKGFLTETPSQADKRSVIHDVTPAGLELVASNRALEGAVTTLPPAQQEVLAESLSAVLAAQLAAKGERAFGICKSCVHHRASASGAKCALLMLHLTPQETTQICFEQVAG
jgi:DNA-binding MarR family transcriptional regulator